MSSFRMFLKNNRIVFITIFIILFIICFSFFKYFRNNFMYATSFYELEDKCFGPNSKKVKFCSSFSNEKDMIEFFEFNNPKNKFARLDAITLTCEIVENELFSIIQLLAPLLIIVMVVGIINKLFNSGMFKNYLLRMNYNQFLKKIIKIIFKFSLVIPMSLVIVFLISYFITKFNFNISESIKSIAVYSKYKYDHFILYGIVICLLQYLMSATHGIISLYCSIKNKNPIIAVVVSYITFIIEYLFIYIVIYSIVLNKIFGLKGYTDYFNITGYWFFNNDISYPLLLLVASTITIANFLYITISLLNKEKVVIEYEKQIS